jgi:hypothetical protein
MSACELADLLRVDLLPSPAIPRSRIAGVFLKRARAAIELTQPNENSHALAHPAEILDLGGRAGGSLFSIYGANARILKQQEMPHDGRFN